MDEPFTTVLYARFTPRAIFGDGSDTTTLTARISGTSISRVLVCTGGFGVLIADGVWADFELFNDGTHGDAVAGDDVWTRSDLSAAGEVAANPRGVDLTIVDSMGRTREARLWPDGVFWIVSSSFKPMGEALVVNDSVRITDYLVNIKDDGTLFPVADTTQETERPNLALTALEFHRYFADEYDFLTVFTDITNRGAVNSSAKVRNEVSGIGCPIFDSGSAYGTNRLLGMNHVANAGATMHEITHGFIGLCLDRSLGLTEGGHWGAVDILGYLQGLQFEPFEGAFRITASRFGILGDLTSVHDRYADLELYLMGLIAAEEVEPHTVLLGVGNTGGLRPGDIVSPTGTKTVTIEDIISRHGPRVPDIANSRKDFRMAGILITSQRFASPAELALYSRLMQHFGSDEGVTLRSLGSLIPSFAYATGFRATMDTNVGSPK